MRPKLYQDLMLHTLVPILALLAVHSVGIIADFYAIFPWYDIMTHAWGGIVIGFFILALITRFTNLSFGTTKHGIAWFAVILAIAIGWEFYEIFVSFLIPLYPFDLGDTLFDVINDLLGAYVAFMWATWYIAPRYPNE